MEEEKAVQAGTEDKQKRIFSNEQFAVWNHLILRDLNKNPEKKKFYKYSKDEIAKFLKDPQGYAKSLRDAVVYRR